MKLSSSFPVVLSLTFVFLCSIAHAGGIGWEAEAFVAITAPQEVFEAIKKHHDAPNKN